MAVVLLWDSNVLSHRNRLSLVTYSFSLRERSLGEDARLPEGVVVFLLWPGGGGFSPPLQEASLRLPWLWHLGGLGQNAGVLLSYLAVRMRNEDSRIFPRLRPVPESLF